MTPRETTHRIHQDEALCGLDGSTLTPYDASVSCPTCRALLELAERRRRSLVRRSVRIIAKLAVA